MITDKILLDTNFLIDNLKWKAGVFRSFRGKWVGTIVPVIQELTALSKGKSVNNIFAKLALRQVKTKGLKALRTKETSADPALVSLSKKGYIIATHDKLLKQRIRKVGGKIIFIRQKKYVVIEQE
jgi:rRNA-processing protein FCF1